MSLRCTFTLKVTYEKYNLMNKHERDGLSQNTSERFAIYTFVLIEIILFKGLGIEGVDEKESKIEGFV